MDFLVLASTLCRLSGKMGRRLQPFICQSFTCFLPHFGTRICYLEQNQTPWWWLVPGQNWAQKQAYQSQPRVARVWLVAGGNFPPCSHVFQMLWVWIQLVTLLHVIPSLSAEFFLSSVFPHSFHTRCTTQQTQALYLLECDECIACYMFMVFKLGQRKSKAERYSGFKMDGCWFKFPVWLEKAYYVNMKSPFKAAASGMPFNGASPETASLVADCSTIASTEKMPVALCGLMLTYHKVFLLFASEEFPVVF